MFSNLCGPTLLVLLCGAGQAASPVRVAETFSLTNDVGFGNSVFVAANHADVGNWNPTNAVKLRWTPGNIWTGRIGIQAGTALQYKFIRRSTDRSLICNAANTLDLSGILTRNIPAQPPAPYVGKTVLYHSAWAQAFIHYRSGSNWLTTPMSLVGPGRTGGENLFRASGFGEAGEPLEFVPNNGAGQWDNPVGGGNFLTSLDVLFLQDKQVFNYQPPAVVSAPGIQTTTIASTVAGIPSRTVRIYLPRGYPQNPTKRYPVLYLHDGQNVFDPGGPFGSWSADATTTSEVNRGGLRECILVGIDNTANRIIEYLPPTDTYSGTAGMGHLYLQYVLDNVRPYINQNFRTLTDPANTATAGSSMGGLISLYFGRESTNFSRVGVLSPAFWTAPNYMALVRAGAKKPGRVYVDMGTAESAGAWNDFLSFHDTLLIQGYALNDDAWAAVGCGDAHNEAAWKKRLPGILRHLLATGDEPNELAQREFPPRLSLVTVNPTSGQASFAFSGLRGYRYELQRATNLLTWTPVAVTPVESLPWSTLTAEDTFPVGTPFAYWRVLAEAKP